MLIIRRQGHDASRKKRLVRVRLGGPFGVGPRIRARCRASNF